MCGTACGLPGLHTRLYLAVAKHALGFATSVSRAFVAWVQHQHYVKIADGSLYDNKLYQLRANI